MTTLLIIIVSIQIILYLILLYSLRKMTKNHIINTDKLIKENKLNYQEYMERRTKVRDLLTKENKEWQPNK